MNIKESLVDLFWKIVLPMFRLRWWIRDRGKRKEFRRHQEWEYMLHSWKTCIYLLWFQDRDKGIEIWGCKYPSRFRMFRTRFSKSWFPIPSCKKSLCKNYFHDPIKDGRSR